MILSTEIYKLPDVAGNFIKYKEEFYYVDMTEQFSKIPTQMMKSLLNKGVLVRSGSLLEKKITDLDLSNLSSRESTELYTDLIRPENESTLLSVPGGLIYVKNFFLEEYNESSCIIANDKIAVELFIERKTITKYQEVLQDGENIKYSSIPIAYLLTSDGYEPMGVK